MSMPATNDSGMYFCRAAIDGYDDVDSNTVTVLVQGGYPCIAHYLQDAGVLLLCMTAQLFA